MAEGIRLEQTRVVFNSYDHSQTVTVSNDDNAPYLLQSGVTTSVEGGKSRLFVVTPPLVRINANSKFSLRIFLKDKSTLPKDRESIFYINTRALPATNPEGRVENNAKLVFVTNIIIKLFYRPDGVGQPNESVYQQVYLDRKQGNWSIFNPTPYYMTLVNLSFNDKAYKKNILIAPYSHTRLEDLSGDVRNSRWQMINDYGGTTQPYQNIIMGFKHDTK